MTLLVADPGPLCTALEKSLESDGLAVASPSDPDLFTRALGHAKIVYLASASFLAGKLDPSPSPDRVASVLKASNAPTVRALVAVLPEGDGYEPEIEAIRRFGTPFVVIRCPPLLEEIGALLSPDRDRTIWLPLHGRTRVTSARVAADKVASALSTEWQGRILEAPADELGPVELVRRAAEQAGVGLRIRRLWNWAYRILSRLRSGLGRRKPDTERLIERLFPELGCGPHLRALPAPR